VTSGETISHLRAVSEGGVLGGRVGGAVLAARRTEIHATQEELAERAGVSPTTVQAWERGRKPLVNIPFTRLRNLRRDLEAAGAAPGLLSLWDRALDADVILAGLGTTDPGRHPLTLSVPNRAMTALLTWPLSGQPPRQLAGTRTDLAAGRAEITAVTAALRQAADRADGDQERPAMLRRQVRYLLAQADDPAARQWAASTQARDVRSPGDLRTWTPRWAAARSAAHVAATAGNLDPLHRFIDQGLADDNLISANLNYWAYWSGESPATWNADSAMTQAAASTWDGALLMGTLLRGIVHAPYRDLCAHTLWALMLLRRPQLTSPRQLPAIESAVSQALQAGALAPSARQHLEQVSYLTRSA
jgi:transcriptional regulator with XRE-family HTH domain